MENRYVHIQHRIVAVAFLLVTATLFFLGECMAEKIPESMSGTWTDQKNTIVVIDGDRIRIYWNKECVCDTIFIIENGELSNTKKRKNWEEYVEFHQHERFSHFETFRYEDGVLVGVGFIADVGIIKTPFSRVVGQ